MSRSWDSYVGPLCTSPVSSLEQRPFRLMVVRRIFALPTRFILGQEPSCGLSFSPTRPARSGACRIPVKNTPRPAQLRFCLHTPLSPMRLPSALSVFPLFSNTGTYQPFSGKILSGRMPAVIAPSRAEPSLGVGGHPASKKRPSHDTHHGLSLVQALRYS